MSLLSVFQAVAILFSAVEGGVAIGAGIAVLTGIGAAIGIGMMVGKSADAVARQPEAAGIIRMNLFIGLATAEASGLFGFVIAIMLIFF